MTPDAWRSEPITRPADHVAWTAVMVMDSEEGWLLVWAADEAGALQAAVDAIGLDEGMSAVEEFEITRRPSLDAFRGVRSPTERAFVEAGLGVECAQCYRACHPTFKKTPLCCFDDAGRPFCSPEHRALYAGETLPAAEIQPKPHTPPRVAVTIFEKPGRAQS